MSFVTEAQQSVLDGHDPKPGDPLTVKHYRLEAAWARAHDLAADAFGGDPTQFFGPHGAELFRAFEAAPPEATAGELVAIAQGMVEKARGPKAGPAPAA
jgi:hypothetical protein